MSNVIENEYNFELFDNTRYIIGEKIGEGSYGYVYKVIDINSANKDLYALKILKPGYSKKYIEYLIKYSANDPENVENLYRSYRGKRPILHQYRMIFLEKIFLPEGELYTGYASFSELANFGNLDQYLKEHKNLNYSDRLEIVTSVLSGIQELHCRSICHSALKAENILVFKKSETAKNSRNSRNKNEKPSKLDIEISLSDFSVIPSFSERSLISPNEFYASYTSPNNMKFPNNGYSFEDDIYSFGLFLWQVAYNDTPFLKEFKEINNIKLINAFSTVNNAQSPNHDEDVVLPIQNDTSKAIPYEYKKKIEERNEELKLLESYNQIQQSTHYMRDNYKLNINRQGRPERHSQNNELLKLYNLIVENQLRPEVGSTIPNRYRDLILKCWDNQPNKRPDLVTIEEEVDKLRNSSYKNKMMCLDYKLSDRQSKSLSRCLNDGNASTYIHTNTPKKEKTKSVWDKLNPRNSIMKIINKTGVGSHGIGRSDLRKTTNLFDDADSQSMDMTSSKNPLLHQNEIEMENINTPELGYSGVPIGHSENNYTTINIDNANDSVVIETNPSPLTPDSNVNDTTYSNAQQSYEASTSYTTDNTNNISFTNQNNDAMMEYPSITTNDTTFSVNYSYDDNENENSLVYPDLELDDDVDIEVLEEYEKLNMGSKKKPEISDPLNSEKVNIRRKHAGFSGIENINKIPIFDFTEEVKEEVKNEVKERKTELARFSTYNISKNYVDYNNNKRNTLFAFLETKNNNNTNDDIELSSSEENLNFYDQDDINRLTKRTGSTNSIKDDLRNSEKIKNDLNITPSEFISSPIAINNDVSEGDREMYRYQV